MFKIGDRVWSFNYGWGVVELFRGTNSFPVVVKFENDYKETYTVCGAEVYGKGRTLFFEEIPIPESALTRSKWRAEKGESYYTITAYGDVDSRVENFDEYDNNLFRAKNYFQTKEEAKESKIYKAFHEEVKK